MDKKAKNCPSHVYIMYVSLYCVLSTQHLLLLSKMS